MFQAAKTQQNSCIDLHRNEFLVFYGREERILIIKRIFLTRHKYNLIVSMYIEHIRAIPHTNFFCYKELKRYDVIVHTYNFFVCFEACGYSCTAVTIEVG